MARYNIVRYHYDGDPEVIRQGVTLQQAQEHCRREDTHDVAAGWFDGYTEDVDDDWRRQRRQRQLRAEREGREFGW